MGRHPQPTLHSCVPGATWKEIALETWGLLSHLSTETSAISQSTQAAAGETFKLDLLDRGKRRTPA